MQYIKYIDLVAKRNAKKVNVNDVYFTEIGIYYIDVNYRLTRYIINNQNISDAAIPTDDYDFLLMGG